MTTPTTPEACRAEQERVLKLLEGITEGEWFTYGDDDEMRVGVMEGGLTYILADDICNPQDAELMMKSKRLARQNAALLGAHAEALEREAALLEGLTALKKKWDAEYDSHGIEHAYEESGGVLIGKGQAADELEELLAALTPASAEGGAE